MCEETHVFQMLAKPVQEALNAQGFSYPTEPQVKVIPSVLKGENLLLVAPTGSGKTEAVLLPSFQNFSRILSDKVFQFFLLLLFEP